MSSRTDHLVDDYLKRLNAELADLPRARRRELVEEISEHIAAARSELAAPSGAEIRMILERLGEPEDIAAEAREPSSSHRGGLAGRRRPLSSCSRSAASSSRGSDGSSGRFALGLQRLEHSGQARRHPPRARWSPSTPDIASLGRGIERVRHSVHASALSSTDRFYQLPAY
jgi:hypothetical protein